MVKLYRESVPAAEAVQFTGKNDAECSKFCPLIKDPVERGPSLVLDYMRVEVGDWIVKDRDGDFLSLTDEQFQKEYAPADTAELLVRQAVDVLNRHIVPDGISDHEALNELYSIFGGKQCNELLGSEG